MRALNSNATKPWRTLPTAVTTKTARGTRAFAARLGRKLPGGSVLALIGDLGAGKTTFVQGLAQGLGVLAVNQVLSPTYTLVNEYQGGRLALVHIDFYRVDSVEAAQGLGLDEQIGQASALTAVEWANRIPELIPPDALWIVLQGSGVRSREIVVTRGLPGTLRRE